MDSQVSLVSNVHLVRKWPFMFCDARLRTLFHPICVLRTESPTMASILDSANTH